MLRIAICDNNKYICSEIEKMILDYEKESCVKFDIEIFDKGESLIEFIRQNHSFDLIFLDIELGTTTGVTVGKKIRFEFDDYISKIVFITAKDGYAEQLFDLQPFNFIKKPIDKEKLIGCIKLAIKLLHMENTSFEYKKGHEIIKVNVKDILYFESELRKVKIITKTETDLFYDSLSNIKSKLPANFFYSHASYLINYNYINRIGNDHILLKNDISVPISQRFLKSVYQFHIQMIKEKNK